MGCDGSQSMNEMISVVIPAYNSAPFLREAIQSVLNQTLPPAEVLVVNDGSTDATAEIAESFGGPVRCLSQLNQGLSAARNRGISEARGEFIALLDADDCWLPGKLASQVELLRKQPAAVASFTLTEYVDRSGRVVRTSVAPRYNDMVEALLLFSCVIGPPSAGLIRRTAFDRVGLFDTRFSQCADWDMWLRLAEAGAVAYLDEPLTRYRLHDSNMSKDTELLERDTFRVLDSFFERPPSQRYASLRDRCYSNHWMILSGSYLHAGSIRESLRCLYNGVRLYPRNIIRPLGMPGRWLSRRSSWLNTLLLKESR